MKAQTRVDLGEGETSFTLPVCLEGVLHPSQ
jgi:hypothetical protein